jgi:glycosyltransferase involved in cell wall biosynthesis
MHILFITHYFPPEVNAPANRTYEHALRWIKEGAQITVITNHPNHPQGKLFDGYRNCWLKREQQNGIQVIRVKTYLTPNKGSFKRTLNFLFFFLMAIYTSIFVSKVDVVVATSPQFFCGLAGTIVKRLKNRPLVLEIRDLWPDSIRAVGATQTKCFFRWLKKVEKWMYFSADRIVALTEAFRQYIIDLGYNAKMIFTIPNSADFERLEIISLHQPLFTRSSRFVLAYIGTLGMAHNLITLVEVADLLQNNPDIHFLIVGDGAEKERIAAGIKTRQLKNMTLLPLQPKQHVPYYLSQIDVGLVILRDDPLFRTVIPSKMFEFMAMQRPILLAAPEGEATHIVTNFNCGVVVEPDNPQKFAEKVIQLYDHPESCMSMGQKGYQAALNHFNRDLLAGQMFKIIQDLDNNSG